MSNCVSGVEIFIKHLEALGVQEAVLSSGSRNAPVLLSLANSSINCHLNQDERSAAFMAMGISLSSNNPTILSCTSGTAVLNYIPGLMEARYQGVPLIVLTADRPPELINQQDGQALDQLKALNNCCDLQYSLPSHVNNQDDFYRFRQFAIKVWNNAKILQIPVHVNIPLREPLYNISNTIYSENIIPSSYVVKETWKLDISSQKILKNLSKILIIAGQRKIHNRSLNITGMIGDYLSNLGTDRIINHAELIIKDDDKESGLEPELIITFGGPILSKNLKKWLRNISNLKHWHISEDGASIDTFGKLTKCIKVANNDMVKCLSNIYQYSNSDYLSNWLEKEKSVRKKLLDLHNSSDTEALVAQKLIEHAAEGSNIFFGNSMNVRYSQYASTDRSDLKFHANRGISGIDGVNSTALGVALGSKDQTFLINGDLSFVHDINALWLESWPSNFKIIVINNKGGGIFKFIDGPLRKEQSKKYFVGQNNISIKSLCEAYNKNHQEISIEFFKTDTDKVLKSDTQIIEIKFDEHDSINAIKRLINKIIAE